MTGPLARAVITGVGAVTPAGIGVEPLIAGLCSGRSYVGRLDQPWARPPFDLGAVVGEIGARERIPARRLRRLGRLSQMAVVAAFEAFDGAHLDDPASVGTALGTGLGALRETMELVGQIVADPPAEVNPSLFPASVMNVAAAHVSMELGLQGYNTTINHREISTEVALMTAAQAIALGHAPAMLAGGVDELSWPVHHGYRRFRALAAGQPRPYRAGRDGLALGEGACVVALEGMERARRRGARVLAQVAGMAVAGEPRPLAGWGPAVEQGRMVGAGAEGGARAVRAALAEAGVRPGDVDLVVGCGCGSPELDRLEARVLAEVFDGRAVPVTTPHGALGTWMASGAARIVVAVTALAEGRICPTLTAGELDPELPAIDLVTAPRGGAVRAALICSFAVGGASAAIVLTGGDQP
jgi:3-oxoacyl-[acyl-carrier-protein] synthase II